MSKKVCKYCSISKPSDLFNGLCCRDCKNKKNIAYKAARRKELAEKEIKRREKIKQQNLEYGIPEVLEKRCSSCKEVKIHTSFTVDITSIYGLSSYCKDCTNIRTKKYREDNAEVVRERKLQYCKNNREKEAARTQAWREANPEKYLLNCKKQLERNKKRYHDDIRFFLRQTLSKEIGRGLRKRGSSKGQHSCLQFLPFSINELKEHLESQFEPWMHWDNHGPYRKNEWNDNDTATWTWQIDHIVRHAKFNYTSMEDPEFQKCWSLENLRPLSAKVNNKENFR